MFRHHAGYHCGRIGNFGVTSPWLDFVFQSYRSSGGIDASYIEAMAAIMSATAVIVILGIFFA